MLISGILVALFFTVALFLRAYLPHDKIFVGNWIKYASNDAYYQMRIVDNLVHNFPSLSSFDPYLLFPGGQGVGNVHFFDWLLAAVTWIIGLGSPTEHTIDIVGVYFPAVLGALIVIPVYFIGKELVGRGAGLISAALVAILPGEFLGRSILGFTDQHVAETLLTTVIMAFLIIAIKAASQRGLSYGHLKRLDWRKSTKTIIFSILAGFFLGLYMLTWAGSLIFVFLIAIYLFIQFVIDHLRRKSTDYLCVVGVGVFATALLMSLLFRIGGINRASLIIVIIVPLVLSAISRFLTAKKIKPAYFPLSVIGAGLVGTGIFYLIAPSIFKSILSQAAFLIPKGVLLTTIEAQPLLFPGGRFSWAVAWGNFSTGLFLSIISLGVLIYLIVKKDNPDKAVLAMWSLVMLVLTLLQRRFAYYFAVNVALLVGCLSWLILERVSFGGSANKSSATSGEIARRRTGRKKSGSRIGAGQINLAFGVVIVFLVVLFPNIQPAVVTASQVTFAPSNAWVASLDWLRKNSPEPFSDPAYYSRLETGNYHELTELMNTVPNPAGAPDFYANLPASYPYPASAYGVMAWWDYGYWITRIAHRIPNANPSQDPRAVKSTANFFISQNETDANVIAEQMKTAYVIIDYETSISKFWAIAQWAGRSDTEFTEDYIVQQQGGGALVRLFYPEYYRSLDARLYNFEGKAVTPQNTYVISYQEKTKELPYRQVTNVQQFSAYQAAEAFISAQQSGNYKIIGVNPFLSPVPLDPVEHYKLVYSSEEKTSVPSGEPVPSVKIFQYTK